MTDLDRLKMMTAWDIQPTLAESELDDLLARAAREDSNGFAPLADEWSETYDLNAAAAEAWLIKAARAAAVVESSPTEQEAASKVFDNCRAMARLYRARIGLSVRTR
jgi:hypothetical protein